MLHKHHSAHHVFGVLIGILFIGSTLGGVTGMRGKSIILPSGALETKEGIVRSTAERRALLIQNRLERRLKREQRLQNKERSVSDVGKTYPMQTNTFAFKGITHWDVALNTNTLTYPRLQISAPIGKPKMESWLARNWRKLEDQMQYLLLNGVALYPHSPDPGEYGSLIIAGHSSAPTMEEIGSPYEDIFATLPHSRIGDTIIVTDNEGIEFIYIVRKIQIIPARYTQILLQDPSKKELVLFTCYPVGTTRDRFAVWAELMEEEAVASR